ncbi:MAG: HDIG domain-containing protein [Methanobacteriaceae archaeon]|nr:HDIG domain-containing protein [Methanobacteriaceae archaeon]
MTIKNPDKIINEIYEKFHCNNYIKYHSKAVYNRAKIISRHYKVDENLIKTGSMLHDIGRMKTASIKHAYIGADLLRKEDIDEKVCLITERHIGAGIIPTEAKELNLPDRNYIPETLEEKIVAHADNLVHKSSPVTLDFVIKKWERKNMHPSSIKRLIKLDHELIRRQ